MKALLKILPLQQRALKLVAVLVPLFALLVFVALRSGPLAPVGVTLATVETGTLKPGLFGIGNVAAGESYRIGPTAPGRLARLSVQVGERVRVGQVLGEMDAVDLDARSDAQSSALARAASALREAEARQGFAATQAKRYEALLAVRGTSEEALASRHHELKLAEAGLASAKSEVARLRAERDGIHAQRAHLRLLSPVDGVVTLRALEPGSTVLAGQTVVEVVNPNSLWLAVRFDQIHAGGLRAELPAQIVLRSGAGQPLSGRVLRVEPLADAVTEETLAKVVFTRLPNPLPPLGEMAEVTVHLPALPPSLLIPNAAVRQHEGRMGVWQVADGELVFRPLRLGRHALDGRVQVLEGLKAGDRVVLYSERALAAGKRIAVLDHIPGI